MHQLCRACVFAKRIAARHTQIGQPLVLKQQKQESLTCFIRFYLTVYIKNNAMEIDPAAFIGAPSVVLYGEHGSEAESYARKQNIMFSAAEDNETVYPRTETIF